MKLLRLFDIAIWLTFIRYIIRASHPVICLLGLISFKRNWKDFVANPIVRLFCIFIIIDLTVKYSKFLSTGIMIDRYMLPVAVAFIIFAADGLLKLIPFVQTKVSEKYPYFTYRRVTIIIFIIVFWVFVGKILIPSSDHPWFEGMRSIVKKECPVGIKPVIISNQTDIRLGYYPDADLYTLSLENFVISDKAMLYQVPYTKLKIKLLAGIENFSKNIRNFGERNVFVFLFNVTDSEFRKRFTTKQLRFPFRLLKSYQDRHKRPVCFYQFIG